MQLDDLSIVVQCGAKIGLFGFLNTKSSYFVYIAIKIGAMALNWNEIKDRAINFSNEWAGTTNEISEAKSFLDAFFNVFGISRRKVALFEQKTKLLDGRIGRIDLIWKGVILIEMKSQGKDLNKAYQQATDYFPGLQDYELPKFIMVCDFDDFRLYDLDENTTCEFKLKDFVSNVHLFDYLLGYEKKIYKDQDPANIRAAELMGKLHDRLKEIGYTGHPLEVYLVRLLFCLFADDTTIFEKQQFQDYIQQRTNEDGSDMASKLQELFQVLNTPKESRFKNLDEQLAAFPYVNGKLFEEILPIACFDSKMRKSLLDCCSVNWAKISPAIFGSMFQSVMNPIERRNLGAHYTSEKNILKVIKPLFLDDLWNEFNRLKDNKNKLPAFHKKLRSLNFLDPACGCGNFLVISYRELRLLELEILRTLYKEQRTHDIGRIVWLDVDQFYGIEYEEFPARIAEVAMWLIDHQMNMQVSLEFGEYFVRLPLKRSAKIAHGNALQKDWASLVQPVPGETADYFSYIFGNPPFVGTAYQNAEQKKDLVDLFGNSKSVGMLDYVTGWYIKAAEYLQAQSKRESENLGKTQIAFVSTNSIAQGEQVGILWNVLFNRYRMKIHFAHRTFKWSNEAKGNAAVHVVIIGFSDFDKQEKKIFEYENIKGEPHEVKVRNINPYLVESKDIFLQSIPVPICNVPKMQSGSAARDGGFLILKDEEKNELVKVQPQTEAFLKPFISGDDFINNIQRWCIWLKGIAPNEFRTIREFQSRFNEVRKFRENSSRAGTKKMADLPYLFAEERQPKKDFLIIPKVSSENRKYIPIAYMKCDNVVSDKTFIVPDTTDFHFGILTSIMHMTWMKFTCGRLESRFSYSNTIVYNNFPWPENPTEKQRKAIEAAAKNVLKVRTEFPGSSLADLYDPLSMPPELVKAHNELDRVVDLAYRPQPFTGESNRMEFLFTLYEKYTAGLFQTVKVKKSKKPESTEV